MPRSKHRRKPGGKAVAKPGRTAHAQANAAKLDVKLWQTLGDIIEPAMQRDLDGLPLFDRASRSRRRPRSRVARSWRVSVTQT